MGTHVHKTALRDAPGRRLRRWLSSEAGKFNFVTLLLLLIVAGAIYAAILFAPPYIDNGKLEEKMRMVANLAHRQKDDTKLRHELERELKMIELDLPYEAIKIERDPVGGKWIDINIDYAREVELVPFGKIVTLNFSSFVHEDF